MARPTVTICKFVGCISLGLLTGTSTSLTLLTLPSLLALPSATPAQHTLTRLRTLTTTHLTSLSLLSTLSLLTAYALSPSRARHPYLLWTAGTVALSAGWDAWATRGEAAKRLRGALEREASSASSSSREGEGYDTLEDSEYAGFNGEEVRRGMEEFQVAQAWRAGISGLGFAMGVVGIWGDGA